MRPVAFVARTLALASAAVVAGAVAAPVEARDDAGLVVRLAQPAQRVVSLGPHLTELAWAAGGGGRLVGAIAYSNHPPEAAKLPVVGDAFAIDYETMVRLKPDLVLAWGSGTNERTKAQLRALGLTVYEVEMRSVAAIEATLRTLGRLMGTGTVAEAAADRLHAQWQALRRRHEGRAPVRVFFQLWPQPLMTVSDRHVIGEALRACGGVNVFADLPTLTPTVNWEAAVQANPQLVVGAAAPDGRLSTARWPQFRQVDAVRRGHLVAVDGELVHRMGPRFVDGAEQLCAAIDAVRQPPATQKPPTSRHGQP